MIEIYADLVFLINFVMDVLIFWIVSKMVKKKIFLKNILIGCFISTLFFCLIIFIPVLRLNYNFFTMIMVLMLGITIAFRPQNMKELIKLIILTNIASFSVGGMSMALFYFTNISNIIGNMVGFYVEDFSFKLLLVISASTYIIIKLGANWIKKIVLKKQKFYQLNIFFENKEVELTALMDTGNTLNDPISNSPVIIVEFEKIKGLLPNELKLIFYENRENDFQSFLIDLSSNFTKRIRILPFASLGNQNGMLIGFRPDFITIIDNENENIIETKNAIIGIYKHTLSKNNDYNGLLNPDILNENEIKMAV